MSFFDPIGLVHRKPAARRRRRDGFGRQHPVPVHASNGSWATLCRPDRDTGRAAEEATSIERDVTCRLCLKIIAARTGGRR